MRYPNIIAVSRGMYFREIEEFMNSKIRVDISPLCKSRKKKMGEKS